MTEIGKILTETGKTKAEIGKNLTETGKIKAEIGKNLTETGKSFMFQGLRYKGTTASPPA